MKREKMSELALRYQIISQLLILMAKKGINQTELGNLVGMHRSYISRILLGRINLTLETTVKLFAALGEKFSLKLVSSNPLPMPTKLTRYKKQEFSNKEELLLAC